MADDNDRRLQSRDWQHMSAKVPSIVVAIAALFMAATGCTRDAGQSIGKSLVFVPQSARDINVLRGGTDVTFAFDEPYPAERLTLLIDNAHHPPNWQRVDELALFPGSRTSDWSAGWWRYLERGHQVHRWIANWRSQDGTVVTYIIIYRWPEHRESDPTAIAKVESILLRPGEGQVGIPPPR